MQIYIRCMCVSLLTARKLSTDHPRSCSPSPSRFPLSAAVIKRRRQTVLPSVSDDGACHKYIVDTRTLILIRDGLVITVLRSRNFRANRGIA